MKTLLELYNKYKVGDWPDKNSTHSYIPVYEKILAPYRQTAKNVLEIGLMSGESLRMWNEYFTGMVYGMDIDEKPINGMADLTQTIKEGYNVCIGDATNPQDVEKYFHSIQFDVVIEDANHDLEQQVKIYETIRPYLNRGGIYIIEDVQQIDYNRKIFEFIGENIQIIDRRKIKNRYDDVIVIIKDK